jgi:gas vesicle protein
MAESYKPKDKKAKLTSSIAKLQKDLMKLNGSFAGKLGSELEEISAYLDTNTGDDFNEQEKEIKRLQKEADDEAKRRQDRIHKEFSGNAGFFAIVSNFEEEFGMENYACLKIWAKDLDEKIKEKCNQLRRDYTKEQKIKELVERKVDFSNLPEKLSDEELSYFRKIYSEIFNDEKSLIPRLEIELKEKLNKDEPINEIDNPLLEILKVYINYE